MILAEVYLSLLGRAQSFGWVILVDLGFFFRGFGLFPLRVHSRFGRIRLIISHKIETLPILCQIVKIFIFR
jgi:hypothetical protein